MKFNCMLIINIFFLAQISWPFLRNFEKSNLVREKVYELAFQSDEKLKET